jgi:S-formylglutathione hydrolase FrmB
MLPSGYATSGLTYPVLYTLTGLSSPLGTFTSMSNLRSKMATKPMIVVTFDNDAQDNEVLGDEESDSWYLDSPVIAKSQFTSFFRNELIQFIDNHYRTAGATKRAVTGFSAGAFGAMQYLAACPQSTFKAVAGMSGAYFSYTRTATFLNPILGTLAAQPARWALADLENKFTELKAGGFIFPPLYITVGTGGDVQTGSDAFTTYLTSASIPFTRVLTAGAHDFDNWNGMIDEVVDFVWSQFTEVTPDPPPTPPAPTPPAGPLYDNSIASTSFDLIKATDTDHFLSVTYLGVQSKQIERQGPNHDTTQATNVWVYRVAFDDTPKTIDMYMGGVNPYDGSGGATYANEAAARVDVDRYTPRLGKLPLLYRRNIHHMEGLPGNGSDTNEVTNADPSPHYFTVCADRMTVRGANNDMEESFFHEATHASIQALGSGVSLGNLDTFNVLSDPAWIAAVAADGANGYITQYAKDNTGSGEDLAEHALFAYTMIFHPDRLPEPDRSWIAAKIPNRIAYFRTLFALYDGA